MNAFFSKCSAFFSRRNDVKALCAFVLYCAVWIAVTEYANSAAQPEASKESSEELSNTVLETINAGIWSKKRDVGMELAGAVSAIIAQDAEPERHDGSVANEAVNRYMTVYSVDPHLFLLFDKRVRRLAREVANRLGEERQGNPEGEPRLRELLEDLRSAIRIDVERSGLSKHRLAKGLLSSASDSAN